MNDSEKKSVVFSGPMFRRHSSHEESTKCERGAYGSLDCFRPKEGGHYNHFRVITKTAIVFLRQIFPEQKANDLNFVLFSTSGVHGLYSTIEDVEKEGGDLTFVLIQPRLCTIHYGNCAPRTKEDYEFLKQLRQTSWDAVLTIGKHETEDNPPDTQAPNAGGGRADK